MTSLSVSPLTRLEGHGRVDLELREGWLHEVRIGLIESPRLFEKIVVGRRFDEVPDLICRICAICSAVHKLTALAALEQALRIEVPPVARRVRELLLLGGHIQSHVLHLFCLVLPDFFGSDHVLDLLRAKNRLATRGLELKALGNRLQEVAGGRVIHPVNPVIGGVRHVPPPAELEELAAEVERWRQVWPELAAEFLAAANYPPAGRLVGMPLAVAPSGPLSLAGDILACGEANYGVSDYAALLGERTVTGSHAKQSCGPAGPFLAGALARQLLADEAVAGSGAAVGIHDNNGAQLREVGLALDRCARLLAELLELGAAGPQVTEPAEIGGGTGTAAMEAPRGLLVHHYTVNEWGVVAAADVVTPTAVNQRAMAEQIKLDLAGETEPDALREGAERIVRSYDPCISCAVHLVTV